MRTIKGLKSTWDHLTELFLPKKIPGMITTPRIKFIATNPKTSLFNRNFFPINSIDNVYHLNNFSIIEFRTKYEVQVHATNELTNQGP